MAHSSITVRDQSFDHASAPRYWHGGRRSITIFYDNLSLLLPVGERFVIAAVKAHRGAIVDERLHRDVRVFCEQEGLHCREHARYNLVNEARGYPAAALERRVEWLTHLGRRFLSKRAQLSIMCGFEHFTALMSRRLLEDPAVFAGADPAMTALWQWHAVEEVEHRAVAFDVHCAAGGTRFERAWTLVLATLVFGLKVIEQQIVLMHVDGCLWSAREWARLLSYLYVRPGVVLRIIPDYFAYFSPGFHPSEPSMQ